MARPRVFLSSTFYDLRHLRADLERFIRELGFEPVLSERGNIPYDNQEKLEEYCYKEITLCDILVAIIGNRFGSPSQHGTQSISQVELKTALDLDKQVYAFVDRSTLAEFGTYQSNRDRTDIVYRHVDNVEIYKFLDAVEKLPRNNPIFPFETSEDIFRILKEQWAGLFQRLLNERSQLGEMRVLDSIKTSARTLDQLVTFLTEERKQGDQAIRDILLSNHPAFEQIQRLLGIRFRIFFSNYEELSELLKARFLQPTPDFIWDDDNYEEWSDKLDRWPKRHLKVYRPIFDEAGKLRTFTAKDWREEYIQVNLIQKPKADDDEIPF